MAKYPSTTYPVPAIEAQAGDMLWVPQLAKAEKADKNGCWRTITATSRRGRTVDADGNVTFAEVVIRTALEAYEQGVKPVPKHRHKVPADSIVSLNRPAADPAAAEPAETAAPAESAAAEPAADPESTADAPLDVTGARLLADEYRGDGAIGRTFALFAEGTPVSYERFMAECDAVATEYGFDSHADMERLRVFAESHDGSMWTDEDSGDASAE
ncbi:hypothetical protein ACWEQ4_00775 [Rhodococcus sp. NPDC003994]